MTGSPRPELSDQLTGRDLSRYGQHGGPQTRIVSADNVAPTTLFANGGGAPKPTAGSLSSPTATPNRVRNEVGGIQVIDIIESPRVEALDGDLPLSFAGGPNRPVLRLLILHDDPDREFDYTAGAEQALDTAGARGWTTISMRNDWTRSFRRASPESKTTVDDSGAGGHTKVVS